MSDIIRLLPDAIANQIAAGEVIQRPASAVKELLENALDAGATRIQLIIKDAGKTLIQVVDNGKGMSPTDARMCFERHATSKITNANDLFAIKTMGFRGEAMASIAAIAQVELRTRRSEDELGTYLEIEGSKVVKQEPIGVAEGTSVCIKNLFFNIPARRKFLKSNPVERRHILEEFQRVALANPEIFFSLTSDGNELYHLRIGNLKQRIVAMFGKSFTKKIVPIEETTDYVAISGFVGKPEFTKKSRGEQFFIVNRRFIKSQKLHKAVIEAYDELLPGDTYPFYVVFIDIDPAKIDVNVHPTKQEINFDDEQIVHTFVNAAVKRSLATFMITPQLDFEQEVKWQYDPQSATPKNNTHPSTTPKEVSLEKDNTPIKNSPSKSSNSFKTVTLPSRGNKKPERDWQEMFKTEPIDGPLETPVESTTEKTENTDEQYDVLPSRLERKQNKDLFPSKEKEKIVFEPFQIHHKYIVYHIKSGIIILDQQSAHERILYEKFLAYINKNRGPVQQLMFPQQLVLSPVDAQLLTDISDDIAALGFDLEKSGLNTFAIKGMPPEMGNMGNIDRLFDGLLAQYRENEEMLQLERRNNLARALARQAAVKRKKVLTNTEMRSLIDQLFACEKPYIAPNGRKTFVKQSLDYLDKQFQKMV